MHSSDHSNLLSQNSTHEHFIKVLEQAAKILEPRFERPQQKKAPRCEKGAEYQITASTSDRGVSNQFKCLTFKDLDDRDVQTLASGAPPLVADVGSGTQTKATDKDLISQIVEIEVDTNEELLHRIYLHYEELHKLHSYIQ